MANKVTKLPPTTTAITNNTSVETKAGTKARTRAGIGIKATNFFKPANETPATFSSRLLARATDALVVLCILFVLVITQIFWFMDDFSDTYQYQPWGRSFVASVIYTAIFLIYEVIFHVFNRGQTPGKLVFNIHLVRDHARDDVLKNERVGIFRVLPRAIFPLTPLLFLEPFKLWAVLICLSLGITVFITTRNKGIHDLMFGTYVVYREPTEEDKDLFRSERRMRRERMEKYSLFSGKRGLFGNIRGQENESQMRNE